MPPLSRSVLTRTDACNGRGAAGGDGPTVLELVAEEGDKVGEGGGAGYDEIDGLLWSKKVLNENKQNNANRMVDSERVKFSWPPALLQPLPQIIIIRSLGCSGALAASSHPSSFWLPSLISW